MYPATICITVLLFFTQLLSGQTAPVKPELRRLSEALKFKTLSPSTDSAAPLAHHAAFIQWLDLNFPLVNQKLEKTVINKYSLVYHWKGLDNHLKPVLLLAHYDVVPAPNNASEPWTHPPFSGHIDEESVWGRGTLDDKSEMLSLFEAIEKLLAENFIPARSVYFAIGHDEETGGMEGAKIIARHFSKKNLSFEFILDEGGAMMKDLFPGLERTVAFIATAEKGYANLVLKVNSPGGHSSVPLPENAIHILSQGISRLNQKPMPAILQEPVITMLQTLSPYLDRKARFAISHMKFFRKKLLKNLSLNTAMNALVRTVLTPTIIQGGTAANVLPETVSATINARIITGETTATTLAFLNKTIRDERISVILSESSHDPVAVSPINTRAWQLLNESILRIFPGVLISPMLSPAMSDSRHYHEFSPIIYRFSPITISAHNKEQIHGRDERIGIKDYFLAIRFYSDFIKNFGNL